MKTVGGLIFLRAVLSWCLMWASFRCASGGMNKTIKSHERSFLSIPPGCPSPFKLTEPRGMFLCSQQVGMCGYFIEFYRLRLVYMAVTAMWATHLATSSTHIISITTLFNPIHYFQFEKLFQLQMNHCTATAATVSFKSHTMSQTLIFQAKKSKLLFETFVSPSTTHALQHKTLST